MRPVFRSLGIYKWEQLGYPYTLKDVSPPDEKTIQKAEEILKRTHE